MRHTTRRDRRAHFHRMQDVLAQVEARTGRGSDAWRAAAEEYRLAWHELAATDDPVSDTRREVDGWAICELEPWDAPEPVRRPLPAIRVRQKPAPQPPRVTGADFVALTLVVGALIVLVGLGVVLGL